MPLLPFPRTAALYTCAYAAAVLADHLSTLEAAKAGAVETNIFFQTSDGALAEGRAVIVFALLWPVMLWLLRLADRRASGATPAPGPLQRQLLGRTAETAALLPIVVIIAKLLVSASNMLIASRGVSIYQPLRDALAIAGVTSWNIQSVICGLVVLGPAMVLGWGVVRWWYGRPRSVPR